MGCIASAPASPNAFPKGITICKGEFKNWAEDPDLDVGDVWVASPKDSVEVVQIVNWAASLPAEKRPQIRPAGARYSWSPIIFSLNTPSPNDRGDVLVDTLAHLNSITIRKDKREVVCGPGVTFNDLLKALDVEDLTLSAYPGGGGMTVGGCISVGSKGNNATSENDPPGQVPGSTTNSVIRLRAVVISSDGKTYEEKEFVRGKDAEFDTLVCAIGRTFITEVVLRTIPQYNIYAKCTFDLTSATVFAPPSAVNPAPDFSYADMVNRFGKVSAIYIPFTDCVWTRTWRHCPDKPATARECTGPYNYTYQDEATSWQTDVIKAMLGQPHETFLQKMADWVSKPFTNGAPSGVTIAADAIADVEQKIREDIGLAKQQSKLTIYYAELQAKTLPGMNKSADCENLWGKSHNMQLFVNARLRVSSHAITVLTKRENLQNVVSTTHTIFNEMLQQHRDKGEFPFNGQFEYRCLSLDNGGASVGVEGSPALTSTAPTIAASHGWDTALVMEVVYLDGTIGFNEFAKALNDRFFTDPCMSGTNGCVLPEWSKQFANEQNGSQWTSDDFMSRTRKLFPRWNEAVTTLKKLDPLGVFETEFNRWLFTVSK